MPLARFGVIALLVAPFKRILEKAFVRLVAGCGRIEWGQREEHWRCVNVTAGRAEGARKVRRRARRAAGVESIATEGLVFAGRYSNVAAFQWMREWFRWICVKA